MKMEPYSVAAPFARWPVLCHLDGVRSKNRFARKGKILSPPRNDREDYLPDTAMSCGRLPRRRPPFGVIITVSPHVLIDEPSAVIADGLQMNTIFSCKSDTELARALGVRGDDRAVVARAAAVHIQIAARTGGRSGFRRHGGADFKARSASSLTDTPGFKCSITRLKISRCTLISS